MFFIVEDCYFPQISSRIKSIFLHLANGKKGFQTVCTSLYSHKHYIVSSCSTVKSTFGIVFYFSYHGGCMYYWILERVSVCTVCMNKSKYKFKNEYIRIFFKFCFLGFLFFGEGIYRLHHLSNTVLKIIGFDMFRISQFTLFCLITILK